MNIDSLKCFQAAATHLNFRKAAQQVFLSPAAFGERIRQLEDSLHVKLFERTTRSIRLTVPGLRLATHVQRVFTEVDRCSEVVGSETKTPVSLRIGTRYELGLSWLTPSLSKLKRAAPERTLSLYFGESEDLLRRLNDGLLDAVITSVRLTGGHLQYAQLHDEHYVFVGHRKADFHSAKDASGFTLLDTQPDLPLFRYLLDATGATEPWVFNATEFLGSISAVRYRVLENAGVAVLPHYFVKRDLQTGKLKRLLPRAPLRSDAFRLVWQRADPRESFFQQLAEELRQFELR